VGNENFTVEVPENKQYGDYATNVALILAKKQGRNPNEVADEIKSKIQNNMFGKVEIANGFINFYLKPEFLQKKIKEIIKQGKKFGKVDIGKKQKVQVEFISANPTGELTLGNGRGGFTGDVLGNILSKAGYKVEKEYYINDAKNSKQIQEFGKTALGKGQTYLNDYLKKKIEAAKSKLNKIKDDGEAGYNLGKEVMKDIKDFIRNKLKIKFDRWVSEEDDLYKKKRVGKIYKLLKKKKLVYGKEGAQWLKTSEYGDDKDWVIVRETGEPTYFLSDIAYHQNKFLDRKFYKVIDIWGADHYGYVARMKAAVKILGIDPDRLDIIIMQLVRLVENGKEVRMSKRTGQFVTLKELVDEVGLDAARFFFLMHSADRHMDFDLDLAKEKSEKNPVYYVQYAYARINSILRKAKSHFSFEKLDLLNHPSEKDLIKSLIKLPEIIEDTAKDYQVQRLPNYAIELATAFHKFYTDCRILGEEKDLEKARLALLMATKFVLENILNLMGISRPERM